jgi:hypothetical protein
MVRQITVGADLSGVPVMRRCNVIGPSDGGATDCDLADAMILDRAVGGGSVTGENSCDAYFSE